MNELKKVVDKLLRHQLVYDIYHFQKKFRLKNLRKMTLIYKPEDLNKEYYNKIKRIASQELEHQIGRLTNFKEIIHHCAQLNGHFVEFGSWRGFSLLWIAYLMEREGILDRKLVGIDGFTGLPYSDEKFRKGRFSDTSLKKCRDNIKKSTELYPDTKKNVWVVKFLYSQTRALLRFFEINKIEKFSFVHIDCDVSQSAKEIFTLLKQGDLLADESYILFDDYGIEQNLRDVIHEFLDEMRSHWDITAHSETRFTKNYFFKKRST